MSQIYSPNPMFGQETNRPAAASRGRVFDAIDSGVQYMDTGNEYQPMSGNGGYEKITYTNWTDVANYIDGTGGGSGQLGGVPASWVVNFYLGTVPLTTQKLVATYTDGSTRGWQIAFVNPTDRRIGLILYGINATASIEIPTDLTVGAHTAAFSIVASGMNTNVSYSLDGAAATTTSQTGTYLPPLTGDTFRIGVQANGHAPLLTDTGIYSFVMYSTNLSNAQLAAISGSPANGRIITPAGVTEDMSLRFSSIVPRLNFFRSGGATPRNFKIVGTLTVTAQ